MQEFKKRVIVYGNSPEYSGSIIDFKIFSITQLRADFIQLASKEIEENAKDVLM